jgi:hypothetical protein
MSRCWPCGLTTSRPSATKVHNDLDQDSQLRHHLSMQPGAASGHQQPRTACWATINTPSVGPNTTSMHPQTTLTMFIIMVLTFLSLPPLLTLRL